MLVLHILCTRWKWKNVTNIDSREGGGGRARAIKKKKDSGPKRQWESKNQKYQVEWKCQHTEHPMSHIKEEMHRIRCEWQKKCAKKNIKSVFYRLHFDDIESHCFWLYNIHKLPWWRSCTWALSIQLCSAEDSTRAKYHICMEKT